MVKTNKKIKTNKEQKIKLVEKDNNPGFSFKIKNNKHVPGIIVISKERLIMTDVTQEK